MKKISTAAFAMLIALSCRKSAEPGHAHEEHEPPAASPAGSAASVSLQGLRGVRWSPAPEPRAEGAWFAGEAVAEESAQAVLASPVGGRVASPPFATGRPVRRGDDLLAIDSPEQAELVSRLHVSQAEADRADAELAREQRLFAAGATSERALAELRRDAAVARAGLAAARAGLASRGLNEADRPGRFLVRAPADGAVVSWKVRAGQGIGAGEALGSFQSAAAKLVRLDLTLPGPDWKLGDPTEVRSSDGRRWKARVTALPSVMADDTRRLTFRLELIDGVLPLPGEPVEVRVPFTVSVILPQSAVQQIEGVWGVFVKTGDDAVFRPVHRGAELGSDVAIHEGVHAGEEIVTDGAYLLKSLWLKGRSGGEQHEH